MTTRDPAPHGYDENGIPKAPYGLNLDGTPRKGNRGAKPGARGGAPKMAAAPAATMSTSSLTDDGRRQMLCDLADQLLISPLAGLSQLPPVVAKIGPRQADALAGDAFILGHYAPGMAEGVILWSKSKPGILAWMDKIEQAAPAVLFIQALLGAGKALVENHLNPNPDLAAAGRNMAAMKMAAMADAVNQQAAAVRQRAAQAARAAAQATQEFAMAG